MAVNCAKCVHLIRLPIVSHIAKVAVLVSILLSHVRTTRHDFTRRNELVKLLTHLFIYFCFSNFETYYSTQLFGQITVMNACDVNNNHIEGDDVGGGDSDLMVNDLHAAPFVNWLQGTKVALLLLLQISSYPEGRTCRNEQRRGESDKDSVIPLS